MPLSVCDASDYSGAFFLRHFFPPRSFYFSLARRGTDIWTEWLRERANALLIVMQLIHGPGRLCVCLYLYSFATVASLVMRQFANAFF
jgi:hypothetical protein